MKMEQPFDLSTGLSVLDYKIPIHVNLISNKRITDVEFKMIQTRQTGKMNSSFYLTMYKELNKMNMLYPDAVNALIRYGVVEYSTLLDERHTLYSDYFKFEIDNTQEVYIIEYNKTMGEWEITKED